LELVKSTEGKLDELARGHAVEMANILGRILSVEITLCGTLSPSPTPGRRGSSPSAAIINVSAPTTSVYLVPLSNPQVRRSQRLQLKPRPDYRLLNRSAVWQDRSISEVDEDAEYGIPIPIRRETQMKTVTGGMTFHHGPGNIASWEVVSEGKDVVVETRVVNATLKTYRCYRYRY